MNLFKTKNDKKALETLIKNTFCDKQSVVNCQYKEEKWCPKTCGYYKKAEIKAKYWNR